MGFMIHIKWSRVASLKECWMTHPNPLCRILPLMEGKEEFHWQRDKEELQAVPMADSSSLLVRSEQKHSPNKFH